MGTRFPYGTFVINMTACVIIGFSLAFLGQHTELNPAWRFLVPVGFVGAYSTFSTFEWEMFSSLQTGGFLIAALYVVLSIFLGLVGCMVRSFDCEGYLMRANKVMNYTSILQVLGEADVHSVVS